MKRTWRWLALLAAMALIVASCGDDGSDDDSAQGDGGPSTDSGEPVQGGEATILFWAEQASLDPVRANPSSGSTGQRDFALYGALVALDPESLEMEPILAESLEPNDALDTWTLVLRDELVFSDGTEFTAEDVMAHWQRIQEPTNRSPAFGMAKDIVGLTVVDELTLEITLVAPNAQFERMVGRSALNYVPSADAVAAGHDLTADPVGAGPFLLESWVRDDRAILVRNPNWYDAPRPYLDRLTLRVATDEDQRIDTLLTGDGDAAYTIVAGSLARAEAEGFDYEGVQVALGSTMNFNVTKPPFDDIEMRRAVTMAVDRQAMIETADGAGAMAADNLTIEGTPWFNPDATVPEFDPDGAQELISDYLARTGQSSITVTVLTGQSPRNMALGRFMQTALGQLDGIEVRHEPVDQPTLLQRTFALDYGIGSWGFPTLSPDPDMYQGIHSQSSANAMGYKSDEVDGIFERSRASSDPDERHQLYSDLFGVLAEDLPFIPAAHSTYAWVLGENFHIGGMFQDGIIRYDLAWVDS